MKFVILGLLLILLIGFFVMVWKAAINWRWYQIVPVCITMLLGVLFLFPTAGVLKSRSEWHKVREKLSKQAAQVHSENRLIKYGDPTDPSAGEGVVALSQRLSKLSIEAGRRWRNLQMQPVNGNEVRLIQPASPNQAVDGIPGQEPEAAAVPAQPLIPVDLVVYGFGESANQKLQTLIPTFYLGEFRVTASTPNQVTLVPTGPLEPAQLQAINSGQAKSWSVYELLPLDSHEPFIAEGSVPDDNNYLGRVDDELVKSLMGKTVSPETLQDYLRDGARSTQDDPPLSRWVKVEFLKNYEIEVDSKEERGALEGGFFDGTGRAVDGRLKRGDEGKVKFKKGDQLLIKEPEDGVHPLIDENVVKPIVSYYLRPLNDYRFILRHIRLRLAELENRKAELNTARTVLAEAIEKSNAMLVANQAIKVKLEQDFQQFRTEKEAISDHTDKLRKQVEETRIEMARLHRSNLELEQRLEQIHRKIEQRINALTLAQ
ncbi:hypothetical protein K227x_13800 [Rubripirellula lacrimiformis]|uniref:Uncharacterized protein n=1 Tax=Rubripirellula lacrimiformis TaxID=1930273 RepID=A0A517N7A2_9BACT|nr:hypothetical protein [Rubripirellula lacrimiformis]QDT03001.1 hypothetical protein K227x_13800 [Rubripirellula lacrimiformis]